MIDKSVGRTAFVLAGGGSLGAVQAGMLAELIGAGVRPDLIVGVSAGALNGAFLAHEPSPEMVERIASLWRSVSTREALGLSWRSLLGVFGVRGHLADARGLAAILRRELPYQEFDGARVPLHIVAADEATGEEVVLSSGNVLEAVLASTAIPGVFAPVRINGRSLVDGAVASGTPIATAARLGATQLIVLPCGFTCVGTAIPRHPIGRAIHSLTLLGARQLRQDYDHYADRVSLRIVPPLCPLDQSSYDYSQGAALIAAARVSTRQWLDGGGLQCGDFPGPLAVHTHDRVAGYPDLHRESM
ncbi:MAG: patatin-like phospholipase family protein [Gammaproteobacteria bacterium]